MTLALNDPWLRVNLVLAILLLVLLSVDRWPADTVTSPPLTTLVANDIRDIRIERGQRLTLHLQRAPSGWALRYPNDAEARPRRVQQLLAIAHAPIQRALPATQSLHEYGLDPPAAILQFDRQSLAFGARDPSQQGRYVLVDGEIRLVDDLYFNLLTLPARHFIQD